MDKDAGILGVEQVEEHEDGSATYQFHMDAHCRGLLAEEGLKLVLYCAAANMDMQLVYDFIEDHIKHEKDELTEYKFGVAQEWHIDRRNGISKEIRPFDNDERQRANERRKANDA